MSEEAIRKILFEYVPPLTRRQVEELTKDLVDYYEHVKAQAIKALRSKRAK